jgi:hypothetical protein
MTGEINQNGIVPLNGGVVHEMFHEGVLDVVLGGLTVREETDLILWNVEVVQQPPTYPFGIVDARVEVPDATRFVAIDSNN